MSTRHWELNRVCVLGIRQRNKTPEAKHCRGQGRDWTEGLGTADLTGAWHWEPNIRNQTPWGGRSQAHPFCHSLTKALAYVCRCRFECAAWEDACCYRAWRVAPRWTRRAGWQPSCCCLSSGSYSTLCGCSSRPLSSGWVERGHSELGNGRLVNDRFSFHWFHGWDFLWKISEENAASGALFFLQDYTGVSKDSSPIFVLRNGQWDTAPVEGPQGQGQGSPEGPGAVVSSPRPALHYCHLYNLSRPITADFRCVDMRTKPSTKVSRTSRPIVAIMYRHLVVRCGGPQGGLRQGKVKPTHQVIWTGSVKCTRRLQLLGVFCMLYHLARFDTPAHSDQNKTDFKVIQHAKDTQKLEPPRMSLHKLLRVGGPCASNTCMW